MKNFNNKNLNRREGYLSLYGRFLTASVVYWSEFLSEDPEVPSSIPGVTRFSEK
jgi:hypothetical protein